ncbi:thioredoxin reductase (NADPH) [Cupriavidus metallidurans]|jgi:thioredoxin reductase (NADPH)|uniref:Ferredoxin--NADP reductase 1 n=1 Tax=Cupriavidus metallidurans (strain ATCC 43123 / DSM 2839 / NBRC 102507 / CH34) TaxID=266264 RepID=FENR1_CUPMC|nr:NAD(P)/FAD-dependent oxidoreductase [Cupriavidus metallidurans]Q1LPH7.1 RecName: Full=Ferredoxin--NADP reductase 1; Short=FNR 1; Short=Fd-NADP(+) reductase 1 [Cupriavidus metallidurans CH34]ABF07949.1 thioredoxin reductase [Cupriavidus metallidurans CH34]AVA33231.1 Ferredoxin--NADP reductase 1 [Cupriavidus metallidurans]MDE4917436.1 NAD(P)/FAD-dependent oxidoreductase [Cupriavidus metallidurans]QGS27762.1 SidA/IucD/PvdA family monooxygenase [Cupriavidus metallidurans]UBM12086.1 NAD(P)/FAD-
MSTTPTSAPETTQTDVLIVGAGPVGLFAAFQAGVLGLKCEIVDVLDRAGGQCTELYPEKPIYDIPAVPGCLAQDLVDRLLEQCAPFAFPMHFSQRAESVSDTTCTNGHPRLLVTTDAGKRFDVAAVLICAGAGAFAPQRVSLPEAAALEDRHLHYAVRDLSRFAGKRVIVAGGGDSALDWAMALRKTAARVTLLHRREGFRAADHTVKAMRDAVAAGEMDFVVGMLGGLQTNGDGALTGAVVKSRDGEQTIPADDLVALYGLVSEPGPIAQWDMDMRAGRIAVDTTTYESSRRGIFAAGDIAFYPNKQKLILSGFHEAALALRKAYHYAFPEKSLVHVHTSNNAALKERLTHG